MTPTETPRRVVVVGASLAGLRTVEALRDNGYDGDLVLVGGERHLPYDRPPLSKEVLSGAVPPDYTNLREADDYGALDLELRLGQSAVDLDVSDREVILHGGESVRYARVVIATGATPRHLPGTAELDGVHVLRTVDDSIAIGTALKTRPRVVVVGAGFIG